MQNKTKLIVLITLLIPMLTLGAINMVAGEHNDEFPTNGCETADHTINVSATGQELAFYIDGDKNPDIQVDAGSCVKVIFDNTSELDHDFTVIDDVTDEDNPEELIHMDTDSGTTTEHLWQMPDRDVELFYFCEVPGHRAGGMEGVFTIGSGGGFLPGIGFFSVSITLLFIVAVPYIKSKK